MRKQKKPVYNRKNDRIQKVIIYHMEIKYSIWYVKDI